MLKQRTRLSVLPMRLRAAAASLLMLIAPSCCLTLLRLSASKTLRWSRVLGLINSSATVLVVGLDGTGDQVTQTPFTIQAARSMLQQFGVNLPPGVNPQTKNMASVIVTAELPPFAKPGQKLDVTVSSMGNAKSLRGGELLLTPLKGGNGEIYAVAQGAMVVSGFGADGSDGSSIQVNTKSAGRIPNGALVEREVGSVLNDGTNRITFNLHTADFTTARNMASAINNVMGSGTAEALDGVSVSVLSPVDPAQKVAYLAELENIDVGKAASAAKVIVNARSGTIVIGSEVIVSPAAVAHGSLTVTIDESVQVSQPGAFAQGGQTAVVPDSTVTVDQEEARLFVMEGGVSLQEIVTAINKVGAAPGDLIAVLEALQQAGALSAQIVVI